MNQGITEIQEQQGDDTREQPGHRRSLPSEATLPDQTDKPCTVSVINAITAIIRISAIFNLPLV